MARKKYLNVHYKNSEQWQGPLLCPLESAGFGFAMTRCEMDGAIDLCGLTKDSIMESLTGKCRNMVRQAERANINVRVSNDFATFWPILESVLTARHAVKPTHTVSEIQRLHELLPNGFRLLAAYNGKIMVGGIVLVTINDSALYTLYMAQEYAAQQHHPMHLLLTEAIKLGLQPVRMCRWMTRDSSSLPSTLARPSRWTAWLRPLRRR
jgi:hypothetical protein